MEIPIWVLACSTISIVGLLVIASGSKEIIVRYNKQDNDVVKAIHWCNNHCYCQWNVERRMINPYQNALSEVEDLTHRKCCNCGHKILFEPSNNIKI